MKSSITVPGGETLFPVFDTEGFVNSMSIYTEGLDGDKALTGRGQT